MDNVKPPPPPPPPPPPIITYTATALDLRTPTGRVDRLAYPPRTSPLACWRRRVSSPTPPMSSCRREAGYCTSRRTVTPQTRRVTRFRWARARWRHRRKTRRRDSTRPDWTWVGLAPVASSLRTEHVFIRAIDGVRLADKYSSEIIGNHRKSSEIIGNHQKSSEIIRNHRQSSAIIGNHRQSSEIIGNHRKSSEIIGNHRKSSEIIGNHRKSSEIIGNRWRSSKILLFFLNIN